MKRIDILGSKINSTNMKEVLSNIGKFIESNSSTNYICVSNVHTVVTGMNDADYRNVTNSAFMAIPDGMPLSWVGRHRGCENMSKCSGPDVMEKLFELSEKTGYTHYFYGGSQETLDKLSEKLKIKYPKLNVVGMYSPPFRELTKSEDEDIVNKINELKPDVIWVGLGAPKQEKWMYKHVESIKSSIMLGVGAAFNFHAGTVKRAPLWMQNHGLEWFYRLVKEPRRLWRRYLVTNTLFIISLIKYKQKEKQYEN